MISEKLSRIIKIEQHNSFLGVNFTVLVLPRKWKWNQSKDQNLSKPHFPKAAQRLFYFAVLRKFTVFQLHTGNLEWSWGEKNFVGKSRDVQIWGNVVMWTGRRFRAFSKEPVFANFVPRKQNFGSLNILFWCKSIL